MSQSLPEFKLIVAGGRDFNDYTVLSREIEQLANTTYANHEVSIVCGMARGADALGLRFAIEHQVFFYEFPADWTRYGNRAGPIRNRQMGDFADGLLAFWDGQSKGTHNMIDYMQRLKKPVHIVRY